MKGRNPEEANRVATPLELLYDLCFAVAFGIAGHQFAHMFSQHHYLAAISGFVFGVFAICWSWIQFLGLPRPSTQMTGLIGSR